MLTFAKYQGIGNDFLIVDLRDQPSPYPHPEQSDARGFFIAKALCDRRLGIGADGVLTLTAAQSASASATMRVLNADGSEAEMCGNGLRCVAKFLLEQAPDDPDSITIDTGAGPLCCTATRHNGAIAEVTVAMGRPALLRSDIPMTGPAQDPCLEQPYQIEGRDLHISAVSMGNPHAIAFVSEHGLGLMKLAQTLGPTLETHPDFPNRCNAEFAHIRSADSIELVVWERGCGITQACGTGACATAVAACRAGLSEVEREIEITLPGGCLTITVASDYSNVWMRGPAEHVYSGQVDLESLITSMNL